VPNVEAFRALFRGAGQTSIDVDLRPFVPVEAVGGFPVLVRNGTIPDSLSTEGSSFLRQRHRRTAIGVDSSGGKFMLAVVDSGGATLNELASLMKVIGAYQALNLDGGPSPDLVVRDGAGFKSIAFESGAEVGSAVGIVRHCQAERSQ
jgi:exopolysaccharide biosynthesis protein